MEEQYLERFIKMETKLEAIGDDVKETKDDIKQMKNELGSVIKNHEDRIQCLESEKAQKKSQDALQAADNGQTKGMHWAIKYPALTGIVSAVLYGVYEFIMRVKDFAGK